MRKLILAVALGFVATFSVAAQNASQAVTQTLPNGTVVVRTPVVKDTCNTTDADKVTRAAIGAAAGYAAGRLGADAANSRNENTWGILGAAAGAILSTQVDKLKDCDKVVGYQVQKTTPDGKTVHTYEEVK